MDTFEYIKTLAQFRDEFPEETRPSWVAITTITMVCRGALEDINLKYVAKVFNKLGSITIVSKGSKAGFEWKLRPNSFMNQVTIGYTDAFSTKAIRLFPNGSIQVTGCSNILDCKRVTKQTEVILSYIFGKKFDIPFEKYSVVMINTNFSTNCRINLYKLHRHLAKDPTFTATYEPSNYAGLIVKFSPKRGMKQVTCSVFSTGNIGINGAENLKEVVHAYKKLNENILSDHRHKSDEEPQLHEIFMGAKFSEWLRVLK